MPCHSKHHSHKASQNYKLNNHLKRNKLRRISKNQKITLEEAEVYWDNSKKKTVSIKK